MIEELLPKLARGSLERDYLSRGNPELFDLLWRDPSTRVLAMHNGKVLMNSDGRGLRLLECDQVPTASLRVFLGRTLAESQTQVGSAIVLAVLSENGAREIESRESNWFTLRQVGATLTDEQASMLVQATALNNWHENFAYCPKCGTPTVIEQGGWVRRCFKDNYEVFPRTDPAVIVAITDENDRLLMGSQLSWEQNKWSILAGFIEPGESVEAAVVREMREETGLGVHSVEYVFSQSWPYPFSLMLGLTAKAVSSQALVPDGAEIRQLRWFSRDELTKEANQLLLPGEITISRALIERWLGEKLPVSDESKPNGSQ